jgi:ABC-type Fe3+ transport system permease subunit/DNA-binding beta-propeller fold protein YncE
VSGDKIYMKSFIAGSLALWILLIFLPLVVLFTSALHPTSVFEPGSNFFAVIFRSFALAAVIALVAVLLGWSPGRLLGTSNKHKDLLLLLLIMPLVLPRYVLYYAWTLILSPTTQLGAYLSQRIELARFIGNLTSICVLILWYWPIAALLISQGWRRIDRQIWDSASLDADRFGIFTKITLPLLARPVLLAFGVCFVLCLSEFATFHLAGVETIGTKLAVLYEETGSEAAPVRAAWPVSIAALILAVVLGTGTRRWALPAPVATIENHNGKRRWFFLFVLIGFSLIAPLVLLLTNIIDIKPFKQFFMLHFDELSWSLAIASVAAVMAYLIAFGALSLDRIAAGRFKRCTRLLSLIMRTSIFLTMLIPASIVGVSLLKILSVGHAPTLLRQSWFIVSAGQAGRFAGVALILLLLMRYTNSRSLSEMASLDGASPSQIWWYIHLPYIWPLFIGSFILIMMFSMTELSATMILLPAGLPNFAQRLLNQMHYARDQQVIASCLILICTFFILTAVIIFLLRVIRLRRLIMLMLGVVAISALTGCKDKSVTLDGTKILETFGKTGRGQGEFIYPRAIDIKNDNSLFIVDKTGRIQHFDLEGNFINVIQMPQIESGKPTGLSVGPDGNLYVADTHYYRVVVFSPEGEMIRQWGQFGKDEGCFIYPTDVAFSDDGRVFVSEYGGNDRISVFNSRGDFLYCFGSPGDGTGQLARPSALCVDPSRERLYVADACNHRIAIYNFDGQLSGYIGGAGLTAGKLRYPYDLAIFPDGTLAVCEYGNNRIQLFSPEGQSIAVYGRAGRQLGELAYPWGLAIDSRRHAFIVDSGNNRIQVWQL